MQSDWRVTERFPQRLGTDLPGFRSDQSLLENRVDLSHDNGGWLAVYIMVVIIVVAYMTIIMYSVKREHPGRSG
jgi:hypothetical protein